MLVAEELIHAITTAGGILSLRGDRVQYKLPAAAAHLVDELREHKPEVITLLRKAGNRITYFPACPACGAYCLYREQNVGLYECQRCGLQGIEEHDARIASFLRESRFQRRVM